ncbi:MAG: hypothetical protein JJE52_07520 [Acidimicrobiia bacterium]|nr:hypothetical protein [Acidimicrobiia bacterium]
MSSTSDGAGSADPVLQRRARLARIVSVAQRLGYGLFLVAIVAFVWGSVTSWSSTLTVVIIGSLLAGSIVLAPAIILGYAVKAADADDRETGRLPPSAG